MTSSLTPIPVLLVTGFLGSGKTTLINRWLQQKELGKIGVVVNEFGQIGIDGSLFKQGDIVELGGGCVCCATGSELWESVLSLINQGKAEKIIIETSGIADANVIVDQYEELSTEWKQKFHINQILCLVDVSHIHSYIKYKEAISQIKTATRILFTKTDLCLKEQLISTQKTLDELGATQERTFLSSHVKKADLLEFFEWCFADSKDHFRISVYPPHEHSQLQSLSWESNTPLLKKPFLQLFKELHPTLVRAKGFVYLTDPDSSQASLFILQFAANHLELEVADEQQQQDFREKSALVLISEHLDETWVRVRLKGCEILHN